MLRPSTSTIYEKDKASDDNKADNDCDKKVSGKRNQALDDDDNFSELKASTRIDPGEILKLKQFLKNKGL